MTPGLVLLALLCPADAPSADCTADSAVVTISHLAPAGMSCGAALSALQMEAAAGPIQGGAWIFSCKERQ